MSICFELYGISGAIQAGEHIYYIAPNNINGIFMLDLNTKNIRRVCEIPWKYPFFAVDMVEKDHMIWCVARKGLQIACYDPRSGEAVMYMGNREERENLTSVLYKDDIYIFPKDIPGDVVRFSTQDRTCYNLPEWDAGINSLHIHDHLRTYTISDDRVAATLKSNAAIIIFDIKRQSSYIRYTDAQDAFFGITTIENGYYLTSCKRKVIYCLNTEMNTTTVYKNDNENGFYHQIWKTGDGCFLYGTSGLDFFQGGKFRSLIKDSKKGDMRSAYIFLQKIGSKIFLWPWNEKKLLEIKTDTFQYYKHSFHMFFRDYIHLFPIIAEKAISLEDYINEISQYEVNEEDCGVMKNTGGNIFKYIQEK